MISRDLEGSRGGLWWPQYVGWRWGGEGEARGTSSGRIAEWSLPGPVAGEVQVGWEGGAGVTPCVLRRTGERACLALEAPPLSVERAPAYFYCTGVNTILYMDITRGLGVPLFSQKILYTPLHLKSGGCMIS